MPESAEALNFLHLGGGLLFVFRLFEFFWWFRSGVVRSLESGGDTDKRHDEVHVLTEHVSSGQHPVVKPDMLQPWQQSYQQCKGGIYSPLFWAPHPEAHHIFLGWKCLIFLLFEEEFGNVLLFPVFFYFLVWQLSLR